MACLPRKRASNLKTIKEGGKESYDRYQNSEKGKAKAKRNDTSEAGQARHKRFRDSDNGKLLQKRLIERAKEKNLNSVQHRVPHLLRNALYSIFKNHGAGTRFFQETSFESKEQLLSHFRESGVDIEEHGTTWVVEHRIPIAVYDHSDPEEVKKCWSLENTTSASDFANRSKGFKILPEECLAVPVSKWPKGWNGVLPDENEREAMRVCVLRGESRFE